MTFLLPASVLTAGAGAVAAMLTYGARSRTSQLFAPSIHRGDPHRPGIALTFDDGPCESTPLVLDYLAQQQVPATFFVCGLNVQRLPAIARRIEDEGHELGNHTWSHIRLCPRLGFKLNLRSPEEIYTELARTQQIIREATGFTPRLFRPPYGFRWFGLREAQRRLQLTGVQWTVIGRDWELPGGEIASLILRRTANGGILCLHDGRDIRPNPDISETLKSLRLIVPELKARGFQFQTVSQLALAGA